MLAQADPCLQNDLEYRRVLLGMEGSKAFKNAKISRRFASMSPAPAEHLCCLPRHLLDAEATLVWYSIEEKSQEQLAQKDILSCCRNSEREKPIN